MQIDVSDEVMEATKKDFVMRSRLANIIDLVAGDAIYHPQSKVEFLRKAKKDQSDEATKPETICFKKLLDEIRLGLALGGVYLLTDVYERYSFLLEVEFGLSTEPYKDCRKGFKLKLENSLPGEIQFVPQLDPNKSQFLFAAKPNKTFLQILKCRSDALEEKHSEQSLFSMLPSAAETDSYLSVFHTALEIRNDIKSIRGFRNYNGINKENAAKVVPDSLYLFLRMLFTGRNGLDETSAVASVHNRMLSNHKI